MLTCWYTFYSTYMLYMLDVYTKCFPIQCLTYTTCCESRRFKTLFARFMARQKCSAPLSEALNIVRSCIVGFWSNMIVWESDHLVYKLLLQWYQCAFDVFVGIRFGNAFYYLYIIYYLFLAAEIMQVNVQSKIMFKSCTFKLKH